MRRPLLRSHSLLSVSSTGQTEPPNPQDVDEVSEENIVAPPVQHGGSSTPLTPEACFLECFPRSRVSFRQAVQTAHALRIPNPNPTQMNLLLELVMWDNAHRESSRQQGNLIRRKASKLRSMFRGKISTILKRRLVTIATRLNMLRYSLNHFRTLPQDSRRHVLNPYHPFFLKTRACSVSGERLS